MLSPSEKFRASDAKVEGFRQLLQNPFFLEAIVVLKDEMPGGDVHRDAEAIASVRVLSGQTGWASAVNMLLSLAEPLPTEPAEEQATFLAENNQR